MIFCLNSPRFCDERDTGFSMVMHERFEHHAAEQTASEYEKSYETL